MTFDRKEFYGLTFSWYMTDAVGSVAMFMSGYGIIPKSVFVDKEKHEEISNFFDNSPLLFNSYLSPDNQKVVEGNSNDIFLEVKAAKRGLFVFDNEEYTDNYNLIALPEQRLKLSDLPRKIQEHLKLLSFEEIIFGDTKRISLSEYFECE